MFFQHGPVARRTRSPLADERSWSDCPVEDNTPLSAASRGTARRIVADGVAWLVYELPATAFDRRNTPSLVFESEATLRRVREFPPEWRTSTMMTSLP
jgi:hypothetical protein